MKKVIISDPEVTIHISEITESKPVFARRDGKLVGMAILEDRGWILRVGGELGAFGHKKNLKSLIECGNSEFNYDFFVE